MDYDQRINKLKNGSDTAIWAAEQIKKKDIEISNYEEVIELLKDRNQQLIDDQERAVNILKTGNIAFIDIEKDSELIAAIYQLIKAFEEIRPLRT